MKDIPVYIFNGFLDSGKTSFINETLGTEGFSSRNDNVLVVLCEEGETELKTDARVCRRLDVCRIDEKSRLNSDKLASAGEKYSPDIVIIEYNGMWQMQELYGVLPDNWQIVDMMTFIDYTTFDMYYNNMRNLFTDKVIDSDFVVFNRCDEKTIDENVLHRAVRASNPRCRIAYEYLDGSYVMDDIKDPLPFDRELDSIEIGLDAYAQWYRDLDENLSLYGGKTVTFEGFYLEGNDRMFKEGFAVGRPIMNCCEADAQMAALFCRSKIKPFRHNDWIRITAKISIEKHRAYGGRPGPVLNYIKAESAEEPEQPIASFY